MEKKKKYLLLWGLLAVVLFSVLIFGGKSKPGTVEEVNVQSVKTNNLTVEAYADLLNKNLTENNIGFTVNKSPKMQDSKGTYTFHLDKNKKIDVFLIGGQNGLPSSLELGIKNRDMTNEELDVALKAVPIVLTTFSGHQSTKDIGQNVSTFLNDYVNNSSIKGTEADAENVCHYKFELDALKYVFSCEKNPQFLNFAVFSS